MLLGFKQQFKEKILDGTKIHTIREDPNNRWQAGKLIHMATGIRSTKFNCFKETTCISTQRIFMTYAWGDIIEITVGDKYLFGGYEREKFAINDGFEKWDDFFEWFYPLIKSNPEQCYSGKLIHWTDFRY